MLREMRRARSFQGRGRRLKGFVKKRSKSEQSRTIYEE
jgi:hypothetical protein